MAEKPTCFMAMPISTHEPTKYGGDPNHFRNVMEHLFEPAIEQAGLKPIRPVAKGSDLIHAGIIKHLIQADLVLVDVSTANPNVYFEFGIRTALDKPVCLVMDEFVGKPPFDTGSLNHHTYKSTPTWDKAEQVRLLSEHVKASNKRVGESQSLWRYFGITAKAAETPTVKESPLEAKMELLLSKLDDLDKRRSKSANPKRRPIEHIGEVLVHAIAKLATPAKMSKWEVDESDKMILVSIDDLRELRKYESALSAIGKGADTAIHISSQDSDFMDIFSDGTVVTP